jgi:hypothetical protein
MADVDVTPEVSAFLRARAELQKTHAHQWVVFSGEQFRDAFDSYESAARYAISNFTGSAFLVRNLDDEEEYVPLIFAEVE